MVMAWLSFLISAFAALTAFLSIPAFQRPLERLVPSVLHFFTHRGPWLAAASTSSGATLLLLYLVFFYPCPWYEIDRLNTAAIKYFQQSQFQAVSDVGERLCNCGELEAGWDIQAKAEYSKREFRTAINFWRRSIKANPDMDAEKNANIADASIWLNDFNTAVNEYQKIYARYPVSDRFRYGLGRALVFSGKYQEASSLLQGLNVNDGGSVGQARIFEGYAYMGIALEIADNTKAQNLRSQAIAQFCEGIKQDHNWKSWILDKNSQSGHLDYLRSKLFPSQFDFNCA